jgi:hypothetical protein|tara:strand:- start:375 stop:602 length:228 start_codon:yes stop_codon:yes gene_type:complete
MSGKDKELIKDPWKELKVLQRKIDDLTEENASLWFLLDELEKSDIRSEENRETLSDAFDKLKNVALMMHRKTEEA